MRRLIEEQRTRKKHLKHAGRLQPRPFLKDCGFTFEESVQWWKQELCKDPEIINAAAEGAGQCHGCPFKQLDLPVLKLQLHKWQVPQSNINEVEKLIANGKHYQLACIEYFQAKHSGHTGDGLGNSPGDFFKESCKHHTKQREKEGKGATQASPE